MQRWLESRGMHDEIRRYVQGRDLRQDLMGLVAGARDDLGAVYGDAASGDDDKRRVKTARLAALQETIAARLEQSGRDSTRWLEGELNNARLASMTLYEGRLPEFRALLEQCEQRIDCFYDAARQLAGR